MMLPLVMSFPFFMLQTVNAEEEFPHPFPVFSLLPIPPGSLLPIPIRLADKETKIMAHPLRKNIAFPVALHELL